MEVLREVGSSSPQELFLPKLVTDVPEVPDYHFSDTYPPPGSVIPWRPRLWSGSAGDHIQSPPPP